MITAADAETFSRCIAVGGVAVFPADTVYGLACEPDNREAVTQLYFLKRRRPEKPAAVMFFDLELALAALPELGRAHAGRAARRCCLRRVTLLLDNPRRRFPLACGPDPATLGLRVPDWPAPLASLAGVRWPVLQSSANDSGGRDARVLDAVPAGSAPRPTSCSTAASCPARRRRSSTCAVRGRRRLRDRASGSGVRGGHRGRPELT